jgi:hypothetical protein
MDASASSPTVMRAHADYAADLFDYLTDEYAEKLEYVEWDGINDDETKHDKLAGASLWTTPRTGNIEKEAFFAVLGVPARKELKKALVDNPNFTVANITDPEDKDCKLTGPAINATNEAIYTTTSWAVYVDAKTTGQAVYDGRIYDIDNFYDTKQATEDIYDAVRHLELRGPDEDPILEVEFRRVNVPFVAEGEFTFKVKTNAPGLRYTSSYTPTATINEDGVIIMHKGGVTTITVYALEADGTDRGDNTGFVLNVVR